MYFVYVLATERRGILYVGVTNNLARRIHEHRTGAVSGFTRTHGIHRLVYAEPHDDVREAIAREKRVKRWRRDWKFALVEGSNPEWRDLYGELAW